MEEWHNQATLEFSAPHTVFKDRNMGRVQCQYQTSEEEKELVDFLVSCSRMGYTKPRGEMLKIVEAMEKKGKKGDGKTVLSLQVCTSIFPGFNLGRVNGIKL